MLLEVVCEMLSHRVEYYFDALRPPPRTASRTPVRGWANEAGNHYFHSLFRMDFSQFRLKFFSPPKK